MPKPSIALLYGFGEGEWHGRSFRAAIEKRGFTLVPSTKEADIVIAHSGGCFYLPDTGKEQLTVLIGPPYWPGRSTAANFIRKAIRDFRYYRRHHMTKAWWTKTLHNTQYIFGGLATAFTIAKNASRHNFYLALQQKKVLIIRNKDDQFLTPDAPQLLREHASIMFRTLPGEHDDCWLHPEAYLDLIQSVYEQRPGIPVRDRRA